MTAIKSTSSSKTMDVVPFSDRVNLDTLGEYGDIITCFDAPWDELLDALGAVRKSELDEANAERDEWKAKAERMAAMAVSEEGKAWRDRDEWKARAEEANAALARVWEVRDKLAEYGPGTRVENVMGKQVVTIEKALEMLNAALDPKPPFTLPTEAGAMFTAKTAGEATMTFKAFTAGADVVYVAEGEAFTASGVMEFTDHRVIEAKP